MNYFNNLEVISKNQRLDPPSHYEDNIEHECPNCFSNDVYWMSGVHEYLECHHCGHEFKIMGGYDE